MISFGVVGQLTNAKSSHLCLAQLAVWTGGYFRGPEWTRGDSADVIPLNAAGPLALCRHPCRDKYDPKANFKALPF
jgi:hypothetical protein